MNQVSTVGLDLAKYIFQLHGADSAGGGWSFARSCAAGPASGVPGNAAALHGGHGGLWQRPLLGPRDRQSSATR